jgi:hypothetical protein
MRAVVRGLLLTGAVATALACAFAGLHASDAPASQTASRLVDRTLLCRTGYSGGARLVLINARSAARHGDKLDWLAQAFVSTPGNPLSKQNSQPTLAGMTAGWPPPPPLTTGGLGYDNVRCGPSRAKVPLSSRGLTGGVANAFGEELRCIVGKTVLVRIRATFRQPVTEEPTKAGDYVNALGRLDTGQLAVRTAAGKPVLYADVAESGRARLFTKGCG